jgi:hypothetical protein
LLLEVGATSPAGMIMLTQSVWWLDGGIECA